MIFSKGWIKNYMLIPDKFFLVKSEKEDADRA